MLKNTSDCAVRIKNVQIKNYGNTKLHFKKAELPIMNFVNKYRVDYSRNKFTSIKLSNINRDELNYI